MKSEHMYIIGFVVFIIIVIVLATRKNEGFEGITYRVEQVRAASPEAAAKGSFYSVPANFQSGLSPRFSNIGYGSLSTDMPSENNRGSPKDPLTYGESIDDEEDDEKDTQTDSKPKESIIYDRLIYAPKKSRLSGTGDAIRGDLAIAPALNTGWFNVSATPHLDLKAGAMTIMGGSNESSRALSKLMYASSGKSINTFSGFTTNQYTTSANGKNGDLQVTAFP